MTTGDSLDRGVSITRGIHRHRLRVPLALISTRHLGWPSPGKTCCRRRHRCAHESQEAVRRDWSLLAERAHISASTEETEISPSMARMPSTTNGGGNSNHDHADSRGGVPTARGSPAHGRRRRVGPGDLGVPAFGTGVLKGKVTCKTRHQPRPGSSVIPASKPQISGIPQGIRSSSHMRSGTSKSYGAVVVILNDDRIRTSDSSRSHRQKLKATGWESGVVPFAGTRYRRCGAEVRNTKRISVRRTTSSRIGVTCSASSRPRS